MSCRSARSAGSSSACPRCATVLPATFAPSCTCSRCSPSGALSHGKPCCAARSAATAPEQGDVGIATKTVPGRFEELVLDFLAHMELERGMARNTLQSYRSDLLQFGTFLGERGRTAEDAQPADIADFLTELARGNGRPPASSA